MIFLTIFFEFDMRVHWLKNWAVPFNLHVKLFYSFAIIEVFNKVVPRPTLVYRIDVHARLLILRKKSPLHGLILVCTFIDFEKKIHTARLFCPAHLMFFENFSTCSFIWSCTSIWYTRVRYHCVPKKHSLARNSLGRGLFYVVNVLRYFKVM